MALRWMIGATTTQDKSEIRNLKSENRTSEFGFRISDFPNDWSLIQKFFDYMEANAEDYWEIPEWETAHEKVPGEEKESPYAAAYEGVTYQDTTDDDMEGAVADGGGPPPDLDFEREADRVGKRLRFVSTVARLWQVAAWRWSGLAPSSEFEPALRNWLVTALEHQQELSLLLDSIFDHSIPEPMGSYESMVEYDRRRL